MRQPKPSNSIVRPDKSGGLVVFVALKTIEPDRGGIESLLYPDRVAHHSRIGSSPITNVPDPSVPEEPQNCAVPQRQRSGDIGTDPAFFAIKKAILVFGRFAREG